MPPVRFLSQPCVYELKKCIGENPGSRVYLAEHIVEALKIRQTVVLKIFTRDLHLQPRLQMESLLRARHCPHLVKVLKLEYFNKKPALILQAIKGLSLKQLLREKSLTRAESLYICQQSLKGLKELKRVGLAHGDLSLSNILIDYKGCVYLSDYGLANYRHKLACGTEPFIAPEVSALEKPADFLSDLFSLGVLQNILLGGFKNAELKLLNHTHFIHATHPLLDPNPLKREGRALTQSPPAPQSLKQKVSEILMTQNLTFHKHQTLRLKPYNPLPSPFKKNHSQKPAHQRNLTEVFQEKILKTFFWSKNRLCGLNPLRAGLFLFILFCANPFASYKNFKPARIFVHTQKWIYAEVGVLKSYAPFQVRLQAGSHTIKWKTYNKEGTKQIHLKPGQTLLLSDHDFL